VALLLDTHAFLWWCDDASELSRKARKAIAEQDCHVSLASFWEIAIKLSIQKLRLPSGFDRYVPEQMSANGFSALEISFRHVAGCVALPWRHRDPFDRLLVSQAIEEEMALVSRDTIFDDYGVRRIW
jgi:PIN domain nuclease of toxin-antitoxin system